MKSNIPNSNSSASAVWRIIAIYATFASLWILVTDNIVNWLFSDPTVASRVSLAKGWLFVVVTALLLYGLIRRMQDQTQRLSERELMAQKDLKASQILMRAVIQGIPDLIWLKDKNGVYLLCNSRFEQLFGVPEGSIIGKTDFDFVDKELADFFRKNDQIAMNKGGPSKNQEWLTFTADGHRELLETTKTPVRDEKGQIIGVLGVGHDITEQNRSELALIESEKRFRELYEKAPLPYQSLDIDANILDVNEAWLSMLGYEQDEVIGRFMGDFLTGDSVDTLGCEFPRLKIQGSIDGPEFDLICKNGTRKRVVINGRIARDGQGKFQRTHCILTDITERKQAEAKLQLAASVFVNAGEGITITDTQGIIVDVNQAFSRITGYSREQAIGQNPRILRSGLQDQAFYEAMWLNLTEQGHWSGEIWNRRQDGEVYAEMLSINALRNDEGDIQQYVGLFSDITAMKTHQKQLEHIAHFDALTNLPNRVLLADRLQQAMRQTQRRGQQLAVVYLDLDGFKLVNDRHGHETGDQVLVMLTKRMKEALREGDTLARMGGDEFVAVLIDLKDTSECLPLVTRLLAAAAQPMQLGEIKLQVSASVGVTYYPQAQDIDADQLLRQADQAMYQAKVAGKNCYTIFDAEQDNNIRGHHESLQRIRQALAQGEFVLHYQPKVNMRTGKIIGAEALIRWQHPEKGLLPPALFLPFIEDHPLAVEVGEWVIDTVLAQMEHWHNDGLDVPVSVNVGARQLQRGDFVERLQGILAKHPNIKPSCLELEVLETSALSDMAQASQVIEGCAELGVMFALDDFGTGYSSLTYLKKLRVKQIKIDQTFVRDMLEDPDDLAILAGVIGLAEAFKREVIAEGVETIEHGTALLKLGCDLAQGYGIARPMPATDMPAWAAAWQPAAAWTELP